MTDNLALNEVLAAAQRRGLIGPGLIAEHIRHAIGFSEVLAPYAPRLVVDLGSGGGIPGAVLAALDDGPRWILVDSRERSAHHLLEVVARLDVGERVEVVHDRAEVVGRSVWRCRADAVVARGFGRPGVVAECAAPLLRPGGVLVVSEPPEESSTADRWPPGPLGRLGLRFVRAGRFAGFRFAVLAQESPCPDRFPRRTGVPEKRPLF